MLLHPRSFTSFPLGGLHVPALSFYTSGRLSCLCPFTCTGGTQLVSVPAAGSGISGEHQSQCLLGRSHEQGPIQLHKVQLRLFEGQKHPTRISSQNPNLLLLLPLREMFSPIPVSSRVKPLKLPSLLPEVQVVQSQPAQLRDIPVALTLLKWLHPTFSLTRIRCLSHFVSFIHSMVSEGCELSLICTQGKAECSGRQQGLQAAVVQPQGIAGALQEHHRSKREGIKRFSDAEAPYATAQIVSPHVLGKTSS